MIRTIEFTQSTQEKLRKDWLFSRFIDDSMLDFKHNKYSHAEYYYPRGNLIVSKSNDTITADWIEEVA